MAKGILEIEKSVGAGVQKVLPLTRNPLMAKGIFGIEKSVSADLN